MSTAIELVRTMIFNASNGDRARSRNVAVIFVHGVLADYPAAMRAATAARRDGITLLVVGVTGNVDRRQLDSIASYPMLFNVYRVHNYYSFINVQTGLAKAACNRAYILRRSELHQGSSVFLPVSVLGRIISDKSYRCNTAFLQ